MPSFFGKGKEKIRGKIWDWENFQSTKGFPVSDQLLDWVIGQDQALKECYLCLDEWVHKLLWMEQEKWFDIWEDPNADKLTIRKIPPGPYLLLMGDPGTGKSLIGRALASHLTKLYKKHRMKLRDVICRQNKIVPSEPKISIHPAEKGKALVLKEKKKAARKGRLKRWGVKSLMGLMLGAGLFMMGAFGYYTWRLWSYWMSNPIVEVIVKGKLIELPLQKTVPLFEFLINSLSSQGLIYLLVGGVSTLAMVVFVWFFGRIGSNMGMKGIGGAEATNAPKLLVDNSTNKAPFVDATGHTSSQLFGSIAWDPYQTGGLGTPEHQRVTAGDVHRANLGILYIDEIKNLHPEEAVTLLTVLEEGQLPITLRSRWHAGGTSAMAVSCYSDDSFVLSEYGIRKWNELRIGDKVWSINIKTGKLELKKIKVIYVYDYDGLMYRIKGNKYDLLVTPNHRVLLSERKTSYSRLEYKTAEEVFKHPYGKQIPLTGKWECELTPDIQFENLKGIRNILPDLKLLDLYELIGWYCSEGHLDHYGKRVVISNTENKEKLISLLKKMNLKFYGDRQTKIPYQQLYNFFKQFGKGAQNKQIPSRFLQVHKSYLERLFKGLMFGDGSKEYGKWHFFGTTSPYLRDTFIEICLKMGKHVVYSTPKQKISLLDRRKIVPKHKYFICSISHKPKGTINNQYNNISKEKYQGKVWCFKLEGTQNSNFFVGRNGKFAFCGNTEPVPCLCFLVGAGNFDSIPQIHPALMDRIYGYGKVVRMNNDFPNTIENRRKYVQFVAQECNRFHLIPFSREACIELVNEGRRRSNKRDALTTKFRPLISIIKTAAVLAKNEKSDLVERKHVLEAINEHCKTIQKQILEHRIHEKGKLLEIDPSGHKLDTTYGLAVVEDPVSGERTGSILRVKASMVKKGKRKQGYFKVSGIAKEGKFIQDSIDKVRSVILRKYGVDIAQDYCTHIDFSQAYGIDGPSAGVTMTILLCALLEGKPIRQEIAVTGEINISSMDQIGVTAVGGLYEKIKAAEYWNFKKVIIPEKNFKYSIDPKDYEIEVLSGKILDDYLREILVMDWEGKENGKKKKT